MARILIEGKPVVIAGVPSPFKHLYLVFIADDGDERVIRGGPEHDVAFGWGSLVLEVDVQIG